MHYKTQKMWFTFTTPCHSAGRMVTWVLVLGLAPRTSPQRSTIARLEEGSFLLFLFLAPCSCILSYPVTQLLEQDGYRVPSLRLLYNLVVRTHMGTGDVSLYSLRLRRALGLPFPGQALQPLDRCAALPSAPSCLLSE